MTSTTTKLMSKMKMNSNFITSSKSTSGVLKRRTPNTSKGHSQIKNQKLTSQGQVKSPSSKTAVPNKRICPHLDPPKKKRTNIYRNRMGKVMKKKRKKKMERNLLI
jgi:hypothetical protein